MIWSKVMMKLMKNIKKKTINQMIRPQKNGMKDMIIYKKFQKMKKKNNIPILNSSFDV